jgi:hypothetical protein
MSKISWRQVLPLALAAFFVAGSLSNIFAPASIYEEYLKWGYPRWFHFVTGSLELTAAILLFRTPTRLLGTVLGCTVMFAALATVILHGEYAHAVLPLIAAALSLVVGWMSWRKRMALPASDQYRRQPRTQIMVVFNRTAGDTTPSIQTLSGLRPFILAFGLVGYRFATSLIHFGSFRQGD